MLAMNPPMSLGDAEVHDLWAEAVGERLRIFVGHCGDQPRATLMVTDANGLFGLAVDTVRMMQLPALLPSVLVVGIGYPAAAALADTVTIRARDLTPTPVARVPGSGGAPGFLDFMRNQLLP